MKYTYAFVILLAGICGTYFIWQSKSRIEIPNKKMVFEQVDQRKLSNFIDLVKNATSKHKDNTDVVDSLNTIMSASKRLTIKTEHHSHAKEMSTPFPWPMVLTLWGSLAGLVLILNGFYQNKKSEEDRFPDKKQTSNRYFSAQKSIGDLNQTVLNINRTIELQAQSSDRYIDLELKEDLSDCFVEKIRLEKIVGNFINASFQLVKSDNQSKGIVIQTAEDEGRYRLICFLDNFDQNHLSNQKLPELLKHFSVLEKQFSGFRPMIDFHYVESKNHQGLEIELSFDNSSELETGLSSSVQV